MAVGVPVGASARRVPNDTITRFVLVEGLPRLEACKALGEATIAAYFVQARQH
jgi:hypothetical protein